MSIQKLIQKSTQAFIKVAFCHFIVASSLYSVDQNPEINFLNIQNNIFAKSHCVRKTRGCKAHRSRPRPHKCHKEKCCLVGPKGPTGATGSTGSPGSFNDYITVYTNAENNVPESGPGTPPFFVPFITETAQSGSITLINPTTVLLEEPGTYFFTYTINQIASLDNPATSVRVNLFANNPNSDASKLLDVETNQPVNIETFTSMSGSTMGVFKGPKEIQMFVRANNGSADIFAVTLTIQKISNKTE